MIGFIALVGIVAIIGGIIYGIISLIKKNGRAKVSWLAALAGVVLFLGAGYMELQSEDKADTADAKTEKTSTSKKDSKKSGTVADETHKSGKFSFDDKINTFKTDKLSYKITKVAFMNSAADQSKKTIVFEADITNNTDQELDLVSDANAHLYIHAKQKASDGKSNKELQPGTLALDANANSPEQARENTMNTSSILPGKTVQGVFMFDLDNNDNPVVVDFDNAGFQPIAKKTYNVE